MCVEGSRIPCENGTKRSGIVYDVYRHHVCTQLTRQQLKSLLWRLIIFNSHTINYIHVIFAGNGLPPIQLPVLIQTLTQRPYLRQPQRILCALLITRRLSHSIRHPTRGILNRATSALYGVADGIGCAFGGVTGGFPDARDYEGLEEGWHE